jgi:hypothetical protein
MLSRNTFASRRLLRALVRKSSKVAGSDSAAKGTIGEDGRHEIWREDINDHDNEPR